MQNSSAPGNRSSLATRGRRSRRVWISAFSPRLRFFSEAGTSTGFTLRRDPAFEFFVQKTGNSAASTSKTSNNGVNSSIESSHSCCSMRAVSKSIATALLFFATLGSGAKSRTGAIAAGAHPARRAVHAECAPEITLAPIVRPKSIKAEPVAPATSAASTSSDSTIVALKILSCILRASEQIGREKVAKILAGSNETSVQGFKSLTTYGILPNYSIRAIVSIIDYLIAEGYIDGG